MYKGFGFFMFMLVFVVIIHVINSRFCLGTLLLGVAKLDTTCELDTT